MSPTFKVSFNSVTAADKATRKQRFSDSPTRVPLTRFHVQNQSPRALHEEGTQGDKLPIAGAMSSARRGGRGRGGVNITNTSTSDPPSGPRNGARGRGYIPRANTRATFRGISRGPRAGGRGAQNPSRGGRATPPPPVSARENKFGSANNAAPVVQDGSLASRFAMVCNSPLTPALPLLAHPEKMTAFY